MFYKLSRVEYVLAKINFTVGYHTSYVVEYLVTIIENDKENQHKHKLGEDVMRIECWTCGKTRKGRIRDDSIR